MSSPQLQIDKIYNLTSSNGVLIEGNLLKANDITVGSKSVNNCMNYDTSCGVVSGFGITDNGNGSVAVAAGVVIMKATTTSNAISYNISLNNSLTPTDLTYNYLCINYNSGSPQFQFYTDPASIDEYAVIALYSIYRSGTTLYITQRYHLVNNVSTELQTYVKDKFGLTWISGLALTSSTRYVYISAGSIRLKLQKITTTAIDTSVSSTFTFWYKTASPTWIAVSSQTLWNNTQFNLNNSSLATLTDGYYSFHEVYMMVDSTVHLISSHTQYSLQILAETAAILNYLPPFLADAIYVGRIVFLKSASTYASIYNPYVNTTKIYTTDHSKLQNLSSDNHTQYALLNGRSGNTLLIDTINEFTSSNGTTINSVSMKSGKSLDSTNSAPTDEKHHANKKYVDDQDTLYNYNTTPSTFDNYKITGLDMTNGSSMRVNISSGTYSVGMKNYTFPGFTAGSSFPIYYHNGGWTSASYTTFANSINNNEYDNGTGLSAMTAGYFSFTDVYITTGNIVLFVQGRAQYSTRVPAETAPRVPTPLANILYIGRCIFVCDGTIWYETPISDPSYLKTIPYKTRIGPTMDHITNHETMKICNTIGNSLGGFVIQDINAVYPNLYINSQGTNVADYSFLVHIGNDAGWHNSQQVGWLMEAYQENWKLYSSYATPGSASSFTTPINIANITGTVYTYMSNVYTTGMSGTTRALYVRDDGLLGYLSSLRAQKVIQSDLTLDFIYDLKCYAYKRKKYNMINNTYSETDLYDNIEYGCLAEEVELINRNLCFYDKVGENMELRGVDYPKLIAPLVNAVQVLKKRLDDLPNNDGGIKGTITANSFVIKTVATITDMAIIDMILLIKASTGLTKAKITYEATTTSVSTLATTLEDTTDSNLSYEMSIESSVVKIKIINNTVNDAKYSVNFNVCNL